MSEVNQAQQQLDRLINEARAEYNKVVPRAPGRSIWESRCSISG